MAKQTINIGSSANDGTGDPLRTGGDKINDNFNEIYEQYTFPFPQFTTTTSTTAYVGPASPAITAYATGQKFQVKIHATSTGAATLNISSVGAKKIFTDPTTQATTGDLLENQIYIFFYDAALDSATGGFLMVGGGGGGGGGHTIEDEGTPLTQRTKLNFVGAGVTVTDDSGDDASVVTIPGGGITAATQAEMITGTDNTVTATPLAVESKRSVKLVSFSNNATGSSTIDCGSKQEVTVVYSVTVTGAITIALSNDSNLEILNVIIPITGANIAITTPSTTRMSRYNEVSTGDGWYQSTKILQVSSVGTADLHELSFKRASTGPTFLLRYDGPARA